MPARSAFGKSTKMVTPPVGTTNQLRSSKTSSFVKLTNESKKLKSSIKKTEDGSPTEIIAYADFNRIYDRNGAEIPYGRYYKTLDVLHSVMTDDVKYFIEKSLENDAAGEWSSLKTKVDNDIADTDDLVNDLANVDIAIENATSSMDILKLNDEEFQQFAKDYLDTIIRAYEKKSENRNLTIDEIITIAGGQKKASDYFATPSGRVEAFKKIIKNFYDQLTAKEVYFNSLRSKYIKDFNPLERLDGNEGYWDNLIDTPSSHLTICLSKIFSYSSGIQIVKNDQLSKRILFNQSNILSPFVGSLEDDKIPVKNNFQLDSAVTLSLFQYLNSRNENVIVPEIERVSKNLNYKSGPDGLIYSSIISGDYNFSDLESYQNAYDKSIENLSLYLDKMTGIISPTNKLTPAEIFKIILKKFKEGLNLAKDNDESLYQLLYLSSCNQAPDELTSRMMHHQFLRVLSKIQYYVVFSEEMTDSGEDKKPKTTLKTSGENKGKSFSKDGAEYTTTQVEDKTKAIFDVSDDPRVIKRLSSGSPQRDQLAILLFSFLRKFPSKYYTQAVQEQINELYDELKAAVSDLNTEQIEDLGKEIADLQNSNKPKKEHADKKISEYFSSGMKKTSGTFWSTAVQAYNEIIENATSSLPDDVKITDDFGRTLYGQFEETALLTLIAKIYISFASIIDLQMYRRNSNDSINDSVVQQITTQEGLTDGTMFAFFDFESNPTTSLVNYSEYNLQKMINELDIICSDETSIDDIEKNQFLYANSILSNYKAVLQNQEKIQNSIAFLNAYGKSINNSRLNLIETFADLFENVNRKNSLDNLKGRELISNLTEQQIIYRRSLLDKYRPDSTKGYLPERISYSNQESAALNNLLKSGTFSSKKSENFRVISAGLPSKTISSINYKDSDIGPQLYSGLIELALYKRDHEFGEIIFKENVKLFDPSLYIIPRSFRKYETSNKSVTGDIGLDIGKQIFFYLYDRDGKAELTYERLMKHERYSSLNEERKKELISNTVISYLLETYIYKTTGMIYDEASSFNLSNDVSLTSLSALNRIADKQISNLKLPLSSEIAKIIDSEGKLLNPAGVGTGDVELILNIAGSAMMKSTSQLDLMIENSKFDRTFTAVIDPDNFKIDTEETIRINDEFGRAMMWSLARSEFLEDGKIISRDPVSGGFSIGDITCQFIPHTMNNESGAMLNASKTKSQKSKKLK